MRTFKGVLVAVTVCFVSGCTNVQKVDDLHVIPSVERRLGKTVYWNKTCLKDEQIESTIEKLLQHDLTIDGAVQIALVNNPHIQELFEEIGISHADLVEAGLFSNPAFDLFIRYPNKKKYVADVEYSITASFIDLFLVPLRVKVAKAELEQTLLRITNEILNVAFEVEETYYELQAVQKELEYVQSIAQLRGIQSEIAFRQKSVANINSLDYQQEQARFLGVSVEVTRVENEMIRLKEKLNRLFGFSGKIQWVISGQSPEVDDFELPLDHLECLAFRERLDLQAARFDVLRLSRTLGVKQWWVYINGRLGIAGERDPDRLNTIGPAFSGEIPLFNYGQAARMRLHAELRQAQDRVTALEISILAEVREAHKLLMNYVSIINTYRSELLPLQNKIVASSEELYNVMGLGIDRLLESKQQELQAGSNYIISVRNYWLARVQLDRALGGMLYKIFNYENESIPAYCQEGIVE